MKQFIRLATSAVLVLLLLTYCVAPPQLKNMIVQFDKPVFESTGKSVRVESVTGSEVAGGHEMFRKALIASLKNSNLFTAVVTEGSADYKLTAFIIGEEFEDKYFEQAIGLNVKYMLYRESTNEVVFDKMMPNSTTGNQHTARIQEMAVKENIIFLLNELSRLKL